LQEQVATVTNAAVGTGNADAAPFAQTGIADLPPPDVLDQIGLDTILAGAGLGSDSGTSLTVIIR
jgi:hypothetical protein